MVCDSTVGFKGYVSWRMEMACIKMLGLRCTDPKTGLKGQQPEYMENTKTAAVWVVYWPHENLLGIQRVSNPSLKISGYRPRLTQIAGHRKLD